MKGFTLLVVLSVALCGMLTGCGLASRLKVLDVQTGQPDPVITERVIEKPVVMEKTVPVYRTVEK